jgi:putative membrane protein
VSEARRLHPASLIGRSLKVLPQTLAGGAGYAAVIAREGFGRILLFALIAAGIGFAVALLGWWRFRYTVGANEILIERGLVHRQRRVIPFDRVQDISIERPLLARLLGTARVKVETGGSGADEGTLDMIGLADAHALRDHIRHRHSGAGSAAVEAPPEEPLLFAMDLPRLLFSGLFGFSLIFLAAIFALLQYLDQFAIVDLSSWFTPERAERAGALVSIPARLGFAGLLVLLGLLAGMARTVARDFGFRLTLARNGLRRRRGLFTLTEAVIPVRRIQAAWIEGGLIMRRLGWHALSFQTLGTDQRQGGAQVAAPFARLAEIAPIVAATAFPMSPPRESFRTMPRRGLLRRAFPWLLLGLIGSVAALAVEPRAGAVSALMYLFGLVALLRWRSHRWALTAEALFVSGGFLNRRLWVIPFDMAQSISLAQGPLQRRLGLSSLLVDTAGASLFRAPEIVDLDEKDANVLHRQLLELFYSARIERRLAA